VNSNLLLFISSQSNLFIKKKLIASGSGPSFKIARKEASKAAFNILKEKCFIVQVIK
jgi:hypothetical protein